MYSEEMLCVPSSAKPRLNALQELFVYYAARQDISVTGKTSQPSFEDILKARICFGPLEACTSATRAYRCNKIAGK
jgi:hypothetical protein